MKLYYANEYNKGMVAILGEAGNPAHTVESNAYRETAEELAKLIREIEDEFSPTAVIQFETIDELVTAYDCPLDE